MTAGQLALLLATVSPDAPVVIECVDAFGDVHDVADLQASGVWGNRVTLSVLLTP